MNVMADKLISLNCFLSPVEAIVLGQFFVSDMTGESAMQIEVLVEPGIGLVSGQREVGQLHESPILVVPHGLVDIWVEFQVVHADFGRVQLLHDLDPLHESDGQVVVGKLQPLDANRDPLFLLLQAVPVVNDLESVGGGVTRVVNESHGDQVVHQDGLRKRTGKHVGRVHDGGVVGVEVTLPPEVHEVVGLHHERLFELLVPELAEGVRVVPGQSGLAQCRDYPDTRGGIGRSDVEVGRVQVHDNALRGELLPDVVVDLEVGGVGEAVARGLWAVVAALGLALSVQILEGDVGDLLLKLTHHFPLGFLDGGRAWLQGHSETGQVMTNR